MQAKLTLDLDEKLIKSAKKYARSQHKSLSEIVAEFFSVLHPGKSERTNRRRAPLGPVTSKLLGSLKDAKLTEDDYKDHLIRKYL